MHRFLLAGAILLSFTASVAAQEPPKVTTLMSRDLTDIPGKEGTMLTWSMRLAERTPSIATTRMHSCTCWKGPSSCRSRGRSQSPFTLVRPSMKGPNDVHLVGRNASKTEPAKFLVVFVKNKGAPILTPVE
jgi:hypothetical protein